MDQKLAGKITNHCDVCLEIKLALIFCDIDLKIYCLLFVLLQNTTRFITK